MYYLEAHLLSKDCNCKSAFLYSGGVGAITESEILGKITVSDAVPGTVPLGRVPSATETFRVVRWVKEQGSLASRFPGSDKEQECLQVRSEASQVWNSRKVMLPCGQTLNLNQRATFHGVPILPLLMTSVS